MSWAIFLVGVGLLSILGKRSPKALSKGMWLINGLIAFMTGAALANIILGEWIAGLLSGLFGWVGGWFGASAGITAGVVVLLVVVVVVLDLMDRVADKAAIAGLVMLPVLFLITSGPVDEAGEAIYTAAERMGTSSLGRLIGG